MLNIIYTAGELLVCVSTKQALPVGAKDMVWYSKLQN